MASARRGHLRVVRARTGWVRNSAASHGGSAESVGRARRQGEHDGVVAFDPVHDLLAGTAPPFARPVKPRFLLLAGLVRFERADEHVVYEPVLALLGRPEPDDVDPKPTEQGHALFSNDAVEPLLASGLQPVGANLENHLRHCATSASAAAGAASNCVCGGVHSLPGRIAERVRSAPRTRKVWPSCPRGPVRSGSLPRPLRWSSRRSPILTRPFGVRDELLVRATALRIGRSSACE